MLDLVNKIGKIPDFESESVSSNYSAGSGSGSINVEECEVDDASSDISADI